MKTIMLCLFAVVVASHHSVAGPSATFVHGSIHVADGPRSFVLRDFIDHYSFHETLHAIQRRGDDYFIVYGSGEWSRGASQERGNCGSGVEFYIRWLHVRAGKVIEQQEGLYLSCWKGRDASEIAWREHRLQWSCQGPGRSEGSVATNIRWSYDPMAPEKGIAETQEDEPGQPKIPE